MNVGPNLTGTPTPVFTVELPGLYALVLVVDGLTPPDTIGFGGVYLNGAEIIGANTGHEKQQSRVAWLETGDVLSYRGEEARLLGVRLGTSEL
jgi:hypothetical protein